MCIFVSSGIVDAAETASFDSVVLPIFRKTCAGCHSSQMASGGLNLKPLVDSSGTLPDCAKFDGAAEMRQALAGNLPQFARGLAGKLLVYALGRGFEPYDRRAIDTIVHNCEDDGYRFQSTIYEVVRSLPFQSRRGETPKGVTSK